jgi:hypothetical protein
VSADWSWEPGFTEMSASELILRKLLSVSDLTVCLDRRSALGKIEVYEVGKKRELVYLHYAECTVTGYLDYVECTIMLSEIERKKKESSSFVI